MNICFFLQRRFAYIGHALVIHLKKNHGVDKVCAYVSMRSSYEYLKDQKDIEYSELILDEDVHDSAKEEKIDFDYLKNLEKEYGLPNLWPYLYLDRVLMNGQLVREYPHNKPSVSYEEMLRLIQTTAKTIIGFIERNKPDVIVISVIGSLGASLLYHIARKKGIRTLNIDFARIENRIVFTDDYKTFTNTDKIFAEIQAGKQSVFLNEAKKFIKDFRDTLLAYRDPTRDEENLRIKKLTNLKFLLPTRFFKSLFWHTKQLFKDLFKKKRNYTDINAWWLMYDKFKRKLRALRGYDFEKMVPGESFAFYPLHYEPEIAIMLYAPLYTNQIELIKQAARSLPVGMFLYVKEHPVMVGYRQKSFYDEIKKIPNVRIIKPAYSGPDIVRKSKLVITITSTSAWEAAILGKPAITFGDVYFNRLPSVKKCDNFEKLAYLVKDLLEKNPHDEKVLENYIAALVEDSVPVDYADLWAKAETTEEIVNNEGIKKMAESLADKIKK